MCLNMFVFNGFLLTHDPVALPKVRMEHYYKRI